MQEQNIMKVKDEFVDDQDIIIVDGFSSEQTCNASWANKDFWVKDEHSPLRVAFIPSQFSFQDTYKFSLSWGYSVIYLIAPWHIHLINRKDLLRAIHFK